MRRDLDNLVTQMHAGGITYDEAVREFKRRFILEVLIQHKGNQCKAAIELGMHRNTLSRTLAELKLDTSQIRHGLKRPPRSERPGERIGEQSVQQTGTHPGNHSANRSTSGPLDRPHTRPLQAVRS